MTELPSQHMRSCIVYLVDTDDIHNFRRSLDLLSKCESLRKYPIIAFHESSLSQGIIADLRKKYGIKWVEIEFQLPALDPSILDQIPEEFDVPGCAKFSMGYRHMCRFFSGPLFNMFALSYYDYVLRLDTDSFLLEPIGDVFQTMIEGRYAYGHRNYSTDELCMWDDPRCFKGFYETFRDGVESMQFNYTFDEPGRVYYTNFEVLNLNVFRSELHMALFDRLDRSGGFYTGRWGDHIFRYAFLKQFNYKVKGFDFDYGHGTQTYTKEQ